MIRSVLLPILLALAIAPSLAQQRTVHMLRALDQDGPVGSKLVHATILELDPGAAIAFHEDLVKLLIDNSISASTVVARLEAAGAGAFAIERSGDKTTRGADVPGDGNVGVRNSGPANLDPAAKQQWAIDHPEAHQEHIRSMRAQPPFQHD